MTEASALTVYIDGAARGNPGPAAYAYVIERSGQPAIEEKGCLGTATNNVAEYTALIKALEKAAQLGGRRVHVASDSLLLVKQMNGEYRVKSADLRPLYNDARRLARQFDLFTVRHIPREDNSRADRLCNRALDRECASGPRAASPPTGAVPTEALHDEAVTCLRSAAASWARGNPGDPPPEAVWDQLWSIVEEHGVLRKPRKR